MKKEKETFVVLIIVLLCIVFCFAGCKAETGCQRVHRTYVGYK